jgi:hypothetical protein
MTLAECRTAWPLACPTGPVQLIRKLPAGGRVELGHHSPGRLHGPSRFPNPGGHRPAPTFTRTGGQLVGDRKERARLDHLESG